MDEINQARQLFDREVDPRVRIAAQDLVDRGLAEWRVDPVVPRVVGLVRTTDLHLALVVVYLEDEDLEVSEDLLD